MICIPDLEVESRRDLVLRLIDGEGRLFLLDDHLLLGGQVVKLEDETPVEVTLTGQGAVVDVRGLGVRARAKQPSER